MRENRFIQKPVGTERTVMRVPPEGTSFPGLFLLRLSFPLSREKLSAYSEACSPQRRELASAYNLAEDRARCLAAGWLLNRAAQQHLRTSAAPYMREARVQKGKPCLPDFPGAHISLSHSDEWVACAIHNCPVGVDIERERSVDDGIAEVFMSPREFGRYAGCTEEDRIPYFFRLWTAKEAYLKAIGSGFSHDPAGVTLDLGDSTLRVKLETEGPGTDGGNWGFYSGVLDGGSRLALCWKRGHIN